MKKLILIALLIASSLTAKDSLVVKLNIKYKGKIYKNYECIIIQMDKNQAQILTTENKIIWVEVGKSSRRTALAALESLKTAEQLQKDYQFIVKSLLVDGLQIIPIFPKVQIILFTSLIR